LNLTETGFGKARRVTKPINGMGRKPLQDVFAVDERIALVPLATCHEAKQGCRFLAASSTPDKLIASRFHSLGVHRPRDGRRCLL
jgi:hypothetical protein